MGIITSDLREDSGRLSVQGRYGRFRVHYRLETGLAGGGDVKEGEVRISFHSNYAGIERMVYFSYDPISGEVSRVRRRNARGVNPPWDDLEETLKFEKRRFKRPEIKRYALRALKALRKAEGE